MKSSFQKKFRWHEKIRDAQLYNHQGKYHLKQ